MDIGQRVSPSRRRSAARLSRPGTAGLPADDPLPGESLGNRTASIPRFPPIGRRYSRPSRNVLIVAGATLSVIMVTVLAVTGNFGWPSATKPATTRVLETLPFAVGVNPQSSSGPASQTTVWTGSKTTIPTSLEGSVGVTGSQVQPVDSLPSVSATGAATQSASGGPASLQPAVVPATVVVHAAGAVKSPGVYLLPIDARVDDVLHAAGGAEATADLDVVNLAQPVKDGDRVFFPRVGQATPVPVTLQAAVVAQPDADVSALGPVDLNSATAEQLDALPGVGPATAQRIIEFRDSHSGFRSVNQLLDVPGIGESKLAALKAKVRV